MEEGWNYSNLVPFNGQTMAIILYEPNVNEPEKKIEKINDLIPVFSKNEEVTEVLNEALALLQGNRQAVKKQKSSPSQNTESKDMNILTAIKTKPFILLAGISGTGKSRLVRTLAYKTCEKEELRVDPKKPGNFELIPILLKNKVGPGQKFPWVKASKNPIRHVIAYTLNMDEMIVI